MNVVITEAGSSATAATYRPLGIQASIKTVRCRDSYRHGLNDRETRSDFDDPLHAKRGGVVPIVKDIFEQVCVATLGNGLKRRPTAEPFSRVPGMFSSLEVKDPMGRWTAAEPVAE